MKRTEDDMVALLRKHYFPQRSNGDEYAFLPHIRNAAGFDADRTLDLLVVGLWPSRGLPFIGHEIKCSRADWQRELASPAKADVFHGVIDQMYLVVSDPEIVREGELPEPWGLMHPQPYTYRGEQRERIKIAKQPRPFRTLEKDHAFTRSFVAALLKNAVRAGLAVTPAEVTEAVDRAVAAVKQGHEYKVRHLEDEVAKLRAVTQAFERESGVTLNHWYGDRRATEVGHALRVVLSSAEAPRRAKAKLEQIAQRARQVADEADRAVAALPDQDEVLF